jgi:hypothetical protein
MDNSSHPDKGRLTIILGGIIFLFIAVSPLLFYSYQSFPKSRLWETSFFSLETGFRDWNAYAWYLIGKIVPLYLLFIWFFTCRHWWHWVLLVPIAMYSFQIVTLVSESNNYDTLEIYYLIPLMMFLIPALYLIRARLLNIFKADDLQSFEQELLREKTTWGQIKDLFQ